MARIIVKLRGKQVSDIPLDDSREYVVGRKEDCDIVLQPEKGISREHFKLLSQNGVWFVELVSRYGEVILAGEKVSEREQLDHGVHFSVAPYEFEFSMASSSPQELASDVGAENQEISGDEKTFVGVAPSVPYVKILDNYGEAKELFRLEGGDSWIAGRENTAAIVIRDQRVSRRQFEIRKINGQFFITDLGSVNGTLVNGKAIGDELTPIRSGDAISVLDNNLVFELHDPNFKQRMELVVAPAPSAVNFSNSQDLLPSNIQDIGGDSQVPQAWGGYSQAPAPYEMHAPMPMPHQTMPQMPYPGASGTVANGKFDFEKNRPKLIIAAVLVLLLAWFFTDSDKKDGDKAGAAKEAANKANDPLAKLKPEEQMLIKQTYQLAKNYYMTGKYELAQSEINKIYQKVPDYEDVRTIERLAREAIAIQEQKRRQDELEKVRRENEKAIQKQADECTKKLNPDVSVEEIEDCLSPVIALEPSHPRILELKNKAAAFTEAREIKAAQDAAYNENVSKLVAIYQRAEKVAESGNNLEAIAAYERVLAQNLPDPRGLKKKSKAAIAAINSKMSTQTDKYMNEAEKLYNAQNLKGAILSLRRALKVDPRNTQLQDKIDIYMSELRKQMMVLYQEGILEESFGNVDGSETKPGAKDRWKKILELDVTDGEYYKKAYIKLKKYGAL